MKSGFVALIGRPNVGKSTLMNHLIGQKIAITSEKAQTTRSQIRTVYTDERGQIVFEDTPGLTRAKNKLGRFMVGVAEKTIEEADVILWIVDASGKSGSGFGSAANPWSSQSIRLIKSRTRRGLPRRSRPMRSSAARRTWSRLRP